MNPKLVAIAGPLNGSAFSLTEKELSIGRERCNGLCIADASVSRRHCLIRSESGRIKISDLDSLNSTFVNGVPVNERFLEHGDQIKIGDFLFHFFLHEAEVPSIPSQVQLDEGNLVTRSTIQLHRESVVYLHPEKVLEALPTNARIACDLNTLLRISTSLNSIRSPEAIQRELVESIFEVVPADRGAILLVRENIEDFAESFSRNRLSGPHPAVQVSRTIIHQVLREGVSLLSNDIVETKAFAAAKSLMESQIRSPIL